MAALERSVRKQTTFGDFQVGWFKQVTLVNSDLIRQVSLYIHYKKIVYVPQFHQSDALVVIYILVFCYWYDQLN